MIVDFDELSDDSKIWIYQSLAPFSEELTTNIRSQVQHFIQEWTSHGNELKASFQILHKYFLIIAVDESKANASGCSIDSLVHFIKHLEETLGITLTDYSKIGYIRNEELQFFHFNEVKELIQKGEINAETPIFNNSITKKSDIEENWKIEAKKSWLNKYFNSTILNDY